MKDITVLLTSCNGLVSPSQIDCLRKVKERKIKIIGTDASDLGVGSRLVDQFFKVPKGDSEDYVISMFKICEESNVDILIPAADEEFLALGKEKSKFKQIGTEIVTNDYDISIKSSDKGLFLNFLKEKGLPCANYFIPKSLEEFEKACFDLGYPQFPVVMKPCLGRGNRGMRIIKSGINKRDLLLKEKAGSPYATLEDIKESLVNGDENENKFPSIVLMEYLPGEEYSVDVLVKEGKPLIIIPKLRLMPVPGLSVVGQVDMNELVIKKVTEICEAFNLSYNVNIQFKYSKEEKLFPYEVNTRIAASIAACKAAGANLIYYGVKLALNEEIPPTKIRNGMKMIRYYKEFYEYSDDLDEQNDKSISF